MFDGTADAAVEELGEDVGVGGRGVGVAIEDVSTAEDSGGGTEEDEDTGGGTTSPHTPNSDRHPSPQYSGLFPQKNQFEQQLPKDDPAQVVTFPHWPFGDMMGVLEGSGGSMVELDGTMAELEGGIMTELDEIMVVDEGSGSREELDGTTTELEGGTMTELDDGR